MKSINWNWLNLLIYVCFSLLSLMSFLSLVENYRYFDELTDVDSRSINKVFNAYSLTQESFEQELRLSIERALKQCQQDYNKPNLDCQSARNDLAEKLEKMKEVYDFRLAYKSIKKNIDQLRIALTSETKFLLLFFIQTIFGLLLCISTSKYFSRNNGVDRES